MTKLRLILMDGPHVGHEMLVEEGQMFTFGREAPADIAMSWDTFLSRSHFRVGNSGEGWRVADAGSRNGTKLNGLSVTEAILKDNDVIEAGSSRIRVELIREPTPPERLMKILRSGPPQLYAIVDAARDPSVLDILRKGCEPYQSLYEGARGEELAEAAPYLVQFTGRDVVFESLVYGGWGNSWGIYLNAPASFTDLRRHLRHFLMVDVEGEREKLYFRFYDPRVLRTWLRTCTPAELAEFFGTIESFSIEGGKPGTVLRMKRAPAGITQEEIPYEGAAPEEAAAESSASA